MAAKAKLTPEQWQECKNRWEGDPREGYMWLVTELNLPITDETVRRKAATTPWRKVAKLPSIIVQAHLRADAGAENGKCGSKGGSKDGAPPIDVAIDLRSGIIEKHRADWDEHRDLFPLSAIAGTIKAGPNMEIGKAAKIGAEVIKLRQEGERRAWGLDAISAPDDNSPSSENLDRIYENAMAKMEKMQKLAEKQYADLHTHIETK